jgi:hypothetical protein
MASAWLIRRFVDPDACFDFRDTQGPRSPGEVTFDTFEGDFTHDGNDAPSKSCASASVWSTPPCPTSANSSATST